MTDDEAFGEFVLDVAGSSPTFTDEMMEKVRAELLKAEREAIEYYKEKAEAH